MDAEQLDAIEDYFAHPENDDPEILTEHVHALLAEVRQLTSQRNDLVRFRDFHKRRAELFIEQRNRYRDGIRAHRDAYRSVGSLSADRRLWSLLDTGDPT